MESLLLRLFQPIYLKAPRDFARPDIAAMALQGAVCLEIGAGMGKHALLFSGENPAKQLIAIERTRAKFEAFAERAAEQQLTNLTPVHADAIPWVVHALPPKSIDELFILYPNPEPKNPAQRWLNMPFFEFLLSRLKDGAQITLASNITSYIDEAEQQVQQVWKLPYARQQVASTSARTRFEVKYLARGETCEQLIMHKPEAYQTHFDGFDMATVDVVSQS